MGIRETHSAGLLDGLLTATPPVCSALPASFQQRQADTLERLKQLALPTRKTESWRYSSRHLKALHATDLLAGAVETGASPVIDQITVDQIAVDAHIITLVNGQLKDSDENRNLLDTLNAQGVTIVAFSDLAGEDKAFVESQLDEKQVDLPFELLNRACLGNGLYIHVAENSDLDRPVMLNLEHHGSGQTTPRIVISAARSSKATVIEHYRHSGETGSLINSVTQISLDQDACLDFIRLDTENKDNAHVGATLVSQQQDSNFKAHCIGFGGQLVRHDFRVRLLESGAECELNGVTLTDGQEHYDNHTEIEHIAPQCESRENYRCIANGRSHIVFNGRIHIHPDAQKTSGAMNNKNLLLSNDAEIDTKPELEIYADDVKCAHGATVGQLDDEEVYYLATRGIGEMQARQLLTLGFVLEILQGIHIESLTDYLKQRLSARLIALGAD